MSSRSASIARRVCIVLACGLVAVFGLGMLAAIAIPAYRDFTIRSQVTEGLALAQPLKTAVDATFRASGNVPADLTAAGLPPDRPEGKYVDSVDLTDGRVDIRYGKAADAALAGRVLSLTPYAVDAPTADEPPLAWRCGAGPEPVAASRALSEYRPGSLALDLPRFVPSSCKP
jgi:type IV pilus assembly protein PilA